MAKTTKTISIDATLSARLAHFRDRINVSQVCQEALEAAIERLEAEEAARIENEVRRADVVIRVEAAVAQAVNPMTPEEANAPDAASRVFAAVKQQFANEPTEIQPVIDDAARRGTVDALRWRRLAS